MSASPHPSLYALDRAAAAGQPPPAGWSDHLAGCAECAAHVTSIQERRALPERLASLASGPAPRARWGWLGGGAALAAALALALVVVLVRGPSPRPPGTYLGAKGGPAASLYVKRGERVFPWAPPEPVRPGDLLRLVVVPDGFSHLAVATPGPEGWIVLFQGDVPPEREFDLPASWRVDAAGAGEELLVVLSRQPVRLEQLAELAVRRPRTPDVWTFVLEIDKIGGR